MHKFFCSYNNLTERYELSKTQGIVFGKVNVQAENVLLGEVKKNMQSLYNLTALLKENEKEEKRLEILDETELLLSNLYYSLFASPFELLGEKRTLTGNELKEALNLALLLESKINIPEYNRLITLIKNNISRLS